MCIRDRRGPSESPPGPSGPAAPPAPDGRDVYKRQELGRGFSFVARQKKFTLDGQSFFIDLVFYNYILKCFVLIDLKMGQLTHQDLGQMQMYVNYYTRELMNEGDTPPIGIVLCADKSDAVVKYTLPEDNHQIFASKYFTYLPTEEELKRELRLDEFQKLDE